MHFFNDLGCRVQWIGERTALMPLLLQMSHTFGANRALLRLDIAVQPYWGHDGLQPLGGSRLQYCVFNLATPSHEGGPIGLLRKLWGGDYPPWVSDTYMVMPASPTALHLCAEMGQRRVQDCSTGEPASGRA